MADRIGYFTEPVEAYQKGLTSCTNLAALRLFLSEHRLLANDALDIANLMTENEWPFYRKGLKAERRGVFAGEEWASKYSLIIMPGVLFNVGTIAHQYVVPWGCAYIQCREAGLLVENDGVAAWKGKTTP